MQTEAYKLLIEAGLVSAGSIEEAKQKCQSNQKPFLINLFEKYDTDAQKSITEALAKFYKLPLLHPDEIIPSPNLIRLCKPEDARRWYFLPITDKGSHVVIGMVDPTDLSYINILQRIFRKRIQTAFIYANEFESALHRFFRNRGARPIANNTQIDTMRMQRIMHGNADSPSAEQPIEIVAAKFIRLVIFKALSFGATDLMIEPANDELLVNLRIEGEIYRLSRLSKSQHGRILSALKQMVNVDKDNTANNQRRSASLRFDGRIYKLLMLFRATTAGESVSIRFVDPRLTGLTIERLDLSSNTNDAIMASLNELGLILVTGPRGSGKSTTIAAFLRHLADGKRRIISLQDLIIEPIPGVKQVQASIEGSTKSYVLRSFLHNTPNVIVIDEASDEETISIALQLATSENCLVILAMESSDVAEAITQLLSKGADRAQLAQTLRLTYIQKTIRKICPDCKSKVTPHADTVQRLQIPPAFTFYAGKGCDSCKKTGYRGTVTIGEYVRITPGLGELLKGGASGPEVYTQGRYDGTLTLFEQALNKAIDGTTSLDEVLGVFALPDDFIFKDHLHLGRIDHLHEPKKSESKPSLDDTLTTVFKAAAKEQAQPADLDSFSGFQKDMDLESESENDSHVSSPSSPLNEVKSDQAEKESSVRQPEEQQPSPLDDIDINIDFRSSAKEVPEQQAEEQQASSQPSPLDDIDINVDFRHPAKAVPEQQEEEQLSPSPSSPLDDIDLDQRLENTSTQPTETPLAEPVEQQSDKLMVLVLDDSPVMLKLTSHILLKSELFDVQTADTVEEAWEKLKHQYFHLIITDHEMPEQTGQEFIADIRKQPQLNHTGTMLLTGNIKEASALSSGADGFVAKPSDPELLVARAKSIAEIYKRMSSNAASPNKDISSHRSSEGENLVDSVDQDMDQMSSLELDFPQFTQES